VLALSRAISIGLIIVYMLYLLLQMVVQAIGKDSMKGTQSMIPGRVLPLEEREPMSPFKRFGLPFAKRRTGSSQWRSTRHSRSLSLSIPGQPEHQTRPGKWMPHLVVASLVKKIRHAVFLDSNDPHDDFYVLHDISHTASSESLPKFGSIEAVSSERRRQNLHQLPFFPPSSSVVRPDTPMSDVGDPQPPGPTERGSPPPLSPPSTPDRKSPTLSTRESQSLVLDTKRAGSDPTSDPDPMIWPDTPSDTDVGDESGRQSPSNSEQSFKTKTPLSAAIIILLLTTAIASITTELAVGAIPELVDAWSISHVFLGFIVLPFVGNAAEHVTAAKMASRNRMVLAKNVAVESATQVILFITPAIVLLGWFRGRNMTLRFDHFEIGCILLTGLVVTFAICRGDSGWRQGLVLHAIYLTVAVVAVFYRGSS
jgi:Ca2+/H+ antiporter